MNADIIASIVVWLDFRSLLKCRLVSFIFFQEIYRIFRKRKCYVDPYQGILYRGTEHMKWCLLYINGNWPQITNGVKNLPHELQIAKQLCFSSELCQRYYGVVETLYMTETDVTSKVLDILKHIGPKNVVLQDVKRLDNTASQWSLQGYSAEKSEETPMFTYCLKEILEQCVNMNNFAYGVQGIERINMTDGVTSSNPSDLRSICFETFRYLRNMRLKNCTLPPDLSGLSSVPEISLEICSEVDLGYFSNVKYLKLDDMQFSGSTSALCDLRTLILIDMYQYFDLSPLRNLREVTLIDSPGIRSVRALRNAVSVCLCCCNNATYISELFDVKELYITECEGFTREDGMLLSEKRSEKRLLPPKLSWLVAAW